MRNPYLKFHKLCMHGSKVILCTKKRDEWTDGRTTPKQSALKLFSSLEHEVLKVSYCDHAVSVVRASSVVNIYLVHTLEATVLFQSSWNFTRMFVLMISRTLSDMGHVRSKTRSLGQISLNPCSPSRGHIFASVIMKLYKNICWDDISVRFEYGSCQFKT